MTSNQSKKTGVGAREAGRQLGVSHSYLLRRAAAKRLPRNEDGSFDIAACRAKLAADTDPTQVRSGDPERWSPGGDSAGNVVTSDQLASAPNRRKPTGAAAVAIEAAGHATDPFDKGMVVAVVMLAHRVGAVMACLAADEGAPLSTAFGLKDTATVGFMQMGEDLLRELRCFSHLSASDELPILYQPGAFAAVNWDVVAEEYGKTADVPAWIAEVTQRRERAAKEALSAG